MAGEYLIDGGSHIDRALTNLAIKGFSGAASNIADLVLPFVPVGRQSDIYYKLDSDNWLRTRDTLRAPLAPANLADWQVSSETYFAPNYSFGTMLAKETLANADIAVQLRENSTSFVIEALARDREVRVANLLTTSGNLGHTKALVSSHASAGEVSWSNTVSSDPLSTITSAHAYVQGRTGLVPNTLIVSWDTYQNLRLNERLLNITKYTNASLVPAEVLTATLRVDRILIGQGIKNTNKEGLTASLSNIWGSGAIVAHISPQVGLQTSTLGLQFRWTPEGFPGPAAIERFDHHDRTRRAEIIHGTYFSDEKIVAKDLGYLIVN